MLDAAEIAAILEVKLSVKEFTTLFDDLNQGSKPDWLLAVPQNSTADVLDRTSILVPTDMEELLSPKYATKDSGIFALFPKLSFGSDLDGEEVFESELTTDAIQNLLKEYQRRFINLKTKWTQTFLEVEASHALVVKDLALLHNSSLQLKEIVGSPDPLVPKVLPLTSGIRDLSDEVKE